MTTPTAPTDLSRAMAREAWPPAKPARGSVDLTRLVQRRTLYSFPTRGDLVRESRARDAWLVLGGVIVGVLIGWGAIAWLVVKEGTR